MAIDTSLLDTKYNNLYQAKLNPLKQQAQTKITDLNNQQQDYENNYNNLIKTYNDNKTDTENKYKNIYAGLDQQNTDAKDTAYGQSNDVDTQVNQNLNRVQEIMAKNGWLGGGENLQAQLQSNSDRMNGQGKVTQDMNKTLLGILNSRNNYQTQEQSDYNDINNKINSAATDKTTKLNQIAAGIKQANDDEAANETALAQDIASQKANELSQLQQAEAQRQASQAAAVAKAQQTAAANVAKQQAAQMKADKQAIEDEFYAMHNPTDRENWLRVYGDKIVEAAGGGTAGQAYLQNLQQNTGKGVVSYYSVPAYLH